MWMQVVCDPKLRLLKLGARGKGAAMTISFYIKAFPRKISQKVIILTFACWGIVVTHANGACLPHCCNPRQGQRDGTMLHTRGQDLPLSTALECLSQDFC